MKHECDLDLVKSITKDDAGNEVVELNSTSAQRKICPDCGQHWLKQDNRSWRAENRDDRRAAKRSFKALSRQNTRTLQRAAVDSDKAYTARRSFRAMRSRRRQRAEAA